MKTSLLLAALAAAIVALAAPALAQSPCVETRPSFSRAIEQALTLVKLAEILDAHAAGEEVSADGLERSSAAKREEAKRLREQAKTRTDAQASAHVRLEHNGRIASGNAAEPDTLVASARAYLNAVNRLMIERGAAAQGAMESAAS